MFRLTPLLALALHATLSVFSASQPATAQPAVTPTAAADEAANTSERLEQHLRQLDRELQRQSQKVVGARVTGARVEGAVADASMSQQLTADMQRLQRHIQFLQRRLQTLDSSAAKGWLGELRRLEIQAQNLLSGRPRKILPPAPGTEIMASDACGDALIIGDGIVIGDTTDTTLDGSSSCDSFETTADAWYRYVAPASGTVVVKRLAADFNLELSVHESCPGTTTNQVTCGIGSSSITSSAVSFEAVAGEEYLIRVFGLYEGAVGAFTLNIGRVATLSGTVANSDGGAPIDGALVKIWGPQGSLQQEATTDALGRYAVSLAPDTYFVTASGDGFVAEAWDDIPCPDDGYPTCDVTSATAIPLTAGQTRGDINFDLNFGATISGTVSDGTDGLAYVNVGIWDVDGATQGSVSTDSTGAWSVNGLASGTYFASTSNSNGFLDELYDDIPCPNFSCQITDGTPIVVTVNTTTRGIDFVLNRLGSIAGTVIDESSGTPIDSITVEVLTAEGNFAGSTNTYNGGTYSVGGLAPGDYFVKTSNYSDFQDEFYDDVAVCTDGTADACGATLVTVTSDLATTAIDFALVRLGKISGHVRDDVTGLPIEAYSLNIFNAAGNIVDFPRTDSTGRFETPGLPPGTYFANTAEYDFFYLPELYDDLPCPNSCNALDGTPIPVDFATTTDGIDFDLTPGGTISGTVTDAATGEPLQYAAIQVWDQDQFFRAATTDGAGRYTVNGLGTGTYFATASDGNGFYFNEIFNNIPCPSDDNPNCDPRLNGDPIAVTEAREISGVDFALDSRSSISGRVTNERSTVPLAGADITIWDATGQFVTFVTSDEEGRYAARGLEPGTYFAVAALSGYLGEIFDQVSCGPDNFCADPTRGTPILVETMSNTTGVDFTLLLISGISGTVTAESGSPLPGVYVDAWLDPGYSFSRILTDSAGRYSMPLPAGAYYLSTENELAAIDEVYDDVACPDGPASHGLCDVQQGTAITLDGSSVRENINFALSGITCLAGDSALCLNQSRFQVEVAWRTASGTSGTGQAVELTADSGYFWFFDADNVELVIKILDGCFAPFDTFWVFAAGLTDVEVEITVTDTLTNAVKTYNNPLGTPFQPVLDTSAFATCDAGSLAPRRRASAPPRETLPREPLAPVSEALTKISTCSADSTELCLNDQRFQVEIFWATQDGNSGQGQAVPLTGDTGFFWFFSPDNVEVVVKVLDACDLAGFNSFWVFAAGLTNVEARLRVTDTRTGESKEYFRSLGAAFQPVVDTAAFSTCP